MNTMFNLSISCETIPLSLKTENKWPDVVEAEVNRLQGLQSVESVAGEILQQVVAQVQGPDINICMYIHSWLAQGQVPDNIHYLWALGPEPDNIHSLL